MKIYPALIHILAPVVAAIILNVLIYAQGWNKSESLVRNKLLPPGYVIAIVWVCILGLLGFTHYCVYPSNASVIIVLAILYCLAYPFLTSGLQSNKSNLYNILSLIFALAVTISVAMENIRQVIFTVPFLLWTMYVNIVTNIDIDTKKI